MKIRRNSSPQISGGNRSISNKPRRLKKLIGKRILAVEESI
jgi:hypothetical protein